MTTCPNAVLHPWLKRELAAVLAATPEAQAKAATTEVSRGAWERWQDGLTIKPTLLPELPPLRMLLVLDNLAGHKTPAFVCWLFEHGIMPLYTPGGRVVAEHGREHPADPQAAGPERAASDRCGPDHRLVRGRGRALERGPDAVHLGWETRGPASASVGETPSAGRLGGLHPRTDSQETMSELWLRASRMTPFSPNISSAFLMPLWNP